MSTDPDTIAFYQARAPNWVFHSGDHHSHQLDAFLDRLPPGARVLELGCGGGRDAARMRERNFAVDATDATPAIVARANQAFNLGARVMAFHELEAEAAYAGVWAHASLLHCPRAALPDVLARIHRALMPGGWHFASFKLGTGEGRDLLGRLHNFPAAAWLIGAYETAGFRVEATEMYAGKASDGTQRDLDRYHREQGMSIWTIEAVCTGTARPFHGAETSAIAKRPREGAVQVLTEGLAPDEQADRSVHGGPEMALHLYPLDHHAWWRERIGDHPALDEPGGFGSNIAVSGLNEDTVHIGDRFRLGTALIEVSQPRQPCWKIEHRFGHKGMVAAIVASGRSGWYFRVIEPGEVAAGDSLERIAIGAATWNVARVFRALVGGKATPDELAELTELSPLTPRLREKAAAKRI